MRTSITAMSLVVLALTSCKEQPAADSITAPISFATALHDQGGMSGTKAQPGVKTASVTTLNSEKFGLYITKYSADASQSIGAADVYSNVAVTVSEDGVSTPERSLYFPSKTDKITAYAYYPYNATVFEDAAKISWSVKANQALATDVKASEFLFSKADGDPASAATPVALEFNHALALLQINLTVPKVFVDETVKEMSGQLIKGVKSGALINLNTKVVSADGAVGDIVPRLVESGIVGDTKVYTYELVMIPQTIAVGADLFNIKASFVKEGVAGRDFKYILKDALILGQNSFHTLSLQLEDYGKLGLTGATVADWENSKLIFDKNLGNRVVSNIFNFQLMNYNMDFSSVDNATVVIDNVVYSFGKSKIKHTAVNNNLATIEVSLPDDTGKSPSSYPFTIGYAEFFNAGAGSLQRQFFDTEVTSSGKTDVAMYEYNSGFKPGGEVGDWGDGEGSLDDKSSVRNTFNFQLINYNKDFSSVDSASVVIDKVEYVFNRSKIKYTKVDRNLTTIEFSLPDSKGKVPARYSYMVGHAEFFNAAKVSLQGQFFEREVTSSGIVDVAMYEYNSGFKPGGVVGDWGEGEGSLDDKLAVNNSFTFSLMNNSATAAGACALINKVKLTFSNDKVQEYNIVMVGTRFAAQTVVKYPFTGVVGIAKYPYTIKKVEYFVGAVSVFSKDVTLEVANDKDYEVSVINI